MQHKIRWRIAGQVGRSLAGHERLHQMLKHVKHRYSIYSEGIIYTFQLLFNKARLYWESRGVTHKQ